MIISAKFRELAEQYREKYFLKLLPYGDFHIILANNDWIHVEKPTGIDISTGESVFIKDISNKNTIVIKSCYKKTLLSSDIDGDMILFFISEIDPSKKEKQDGMKCEKIIAINKDKRGFIICKDGSFEIYPSSISRYVSDFNFFEWIDREKTIADVSHIFGKIVTNKKYQNYVLCTKKNICDFLCQEEAVRKYGKRQILIDNISRKKLKEVPLKEAKNKTISYAVIQKVDDEYNVIRAFIQHDNDRAEVLRFYFNENECIRCRSSIDGWICVKGIQSKNMKYDIDFEDIDEDCLNSGIIKYIIPILKAIPREKRMLTIYSCICNPIVEQLFKYGFESLVYYIIANQKHTMECHLKDHLYIIDSEKKSLTGQLGFNNYQLKKIASYYQNALISDDDDGDWDVDEDIIEKCLLYKMSNIFLYYGEVDFSSIDNKTFDEIFERMLVVIDESDLYYAFSGVIIGRGMNSIKNFLSVYDATMRIKEDIASKYKIFELNDMGIDLYDICEESLDTLRMADDINMKVSLTNINTYEQLKLLHDNVLLMYNIAEGNQTVDYDFTKFYKQWEQYVYSNNMYSIIYPKDPMDLAIEGITLHHCVKTYTDAVNSGRTIILFLRKNENINSPYFTIEVKNKEIRQIHGSCNCNLSTDKDAEKFIKEWMLEKKIKGDDYDKALCALRV